MGLKLRIAFENLSIELGNEEERSPLAVAFASVATPYVLDWMKRNGFTWWDRPPASSPPASSDAVAAAEEPEPHVVDGKGPFESAAAESRAEKNNAAAASEV